MARSPRNYAAERARAKARAAQLGFSPSAALGNPRKGEVGKRASGFDARTSAGRSAITLRLAPPAAPVKPARVRRIVRLGRSQQRRWLGVNLPIGLGPGELRQNRGAARAAMRRMIAAGNDKQGAYVEIHFPDGSVRNAGRYTASSILANVIGAEAEWANWWADKFYIDVPGDCGLALVWNV